MRFSPDKPRHFSKVSEPNKIGKSLASVGWGKRLEVLKERGRHLHSREHLLADDLSRITGEPKRFAAYLGIAKLYYESDLRALAKYVREKYDRGELPPEARGKYFFAALKGFSKKHGIKFKRKKKKLKKEWQRQDL